MLLVLIEMGSDCFQRKNFLAWHNSTSSSVMMGYCFIAKAFEVNSR